MDTLQRLRQLVAEKLDVAEESLAENIPIKALGWDSLDLLELIVTVEQEFDIYLNEVRFERCETLGEAADLINAALRG